MKLFIKRLLQQILLFFLLFRPSYCLELLKLEDLKTFFPGASITDIKAKWGEGIPLVFQKKKSVEGRLFIIQKKDALVKAVVQIVQEKIYDVYFTFPSYFRHDPFHRKLIESFGIQNEYFHLDEAAIYHWQTKDFQVYYGASCTITCFSQYLSVFPLGEISKKMEVMPLFWQFLLSERGDLGLIN